MSVVLEDFEINVNSLARLDDFSTYAESARCDNSLALYRFTTCANSLTIVHTAHAHTGGLYSPIKGKHWQTFSNCFFARKCQKAVGRSGFIS